MSPTLVLALALALPLQGGAPGRDAGSSALVVPSAGGLFEARLAKAAGQERVPDAIARWKLEVRDVDGRTLWSCFHPAAQESTLYRLSEDGLVFVAVEPGWSDSRAVVTLRSGEGEPTRLFGGDLGIPREALRAAQPPGTWLDQGQDPARFGWVPGPFGPRQMLELACLDGVLRRIDLASGLPIDAGGAQVQVRVEPPFEKETVPPSRVPAVTGFSAPERVAGDEPLVVRVEGEHPNPGWRIFAFGLEPGGEDGRTLVLTPRARPPMPGGLVLQQVEPYVAEARVIGLPPGSYAVVVQGHEGLVGPAQPFEVTPGGILAELRSTGGILGLDETVTLFENGVVQTVSNRPERRRMAYAAPRAFAEARAALLRLPPLSPGAKSPGSDLMRYELRWRTTQGWRELEADDGSARGELRAAVDAVRALAQP